jgi:hypothetical protein
MSEARVGSVVLTSKIFEKMCSRMVRNLFTVRTLSLEEFGQNFRVLMQSGVATKEVVWTKDEAGGLTGTHGGIRKLEVSVDTEESVNDLTCCRCETVLLGGVVVAVLGLTEIALLGLSLQL